tara:strand:+ start:374 stop:667 length:294 start_codon:yes stop_codon:yes gene_type:complete
MNWKDYSSLKSGSKVSFAKEKETTKEATETSPKEEREYVVLVTKRWDASTGEAQADSKREYSLSDLERDKARYDSDIARAQAQSDGLAAAISDFKKV